jgi:YggT family protein
MNGQRPHYEMPPVPPERRTPPASPSQPSAHSLSATPRFNSERDPLAVPDYFVHEGEPEWLRKHRTAQIIKAVVRVVVLLIGLRFLLLLLGANPDAAFTRLLYGITAPLVFPFQEVFPDPQRPGSMVEVASLLAMVIYWLLGRIIARFVYLRKPKGHT